MFGVWAINFNKINFKYIYTPKKNINKTFFDEIRDNLIKSDFQLQKYHDLFLKSIVCTLIEEANRILSWILFFLFNL